MSRSQREPAHNTGEYHLPPGCLARAPANCSGIAGIGDANTSPDVIGAGVADRA
jgi:hypothetical protein